MAVIGADTVKRALQAEIVRQASPLQRMPRRQRVHRLAMIEHEIARLCLIEERLIEMAMANGEVVERRSDAPPSAPASAANRLSASKKPNHPGLREQLNRRGNFLRCLGAIL